MSFLEKVSSLFAGPVKAPIVKKEETSAPDNSPIPNGAPACPRCGGILVEVSANILRGCQYGFQTTAPARRPTLPPIIVKPSTMPSACPICHDTLMQQIGAEWRCAGCGWQSGTNQPTNGVPRSELETFSGARAKINPPNFFTALARFGRR